MDWNNEQRPERESQALTNKAKSLFEAIVADDPEKACDFFFPREPFTPLKKSKDPDRYWKHLYRTYERDIHDLHRRHRDWTNAVFEGIEPGTPPVWIPPGREANKIGYHKSRRAKLIYSIGGRRRTIELHTIISWQEAWYITHLAPYT